MMILLVTCKIYYYILKLLFKYYIYIYLYMYIYILIQFIDSNMKLINKFKTFNNICHDFVLNYII